MGDHRLRAAFQVIIYEARFFNNNYCERSEHFTILPSSLSHRAENLQQFNSIIGNSTKFGAESSMIRRGSLWTAENMTNIKNIKALNYMHTIYVLLLYAHHLCITTICTPFMYYRYMHTIYVLLLYEQFLHTINVLLLYVPHLCITAIPC